MKFEAKKNELSKHFVSLKDGEEIIGVFRGEPHTHYVHWVGSHSEPCPGRNDCEKCSSGDKGTFKFRLNMVVKNQSGQWEAKVLEQGWKLYNALGEINTEFPLEKNYIKVKRTGKTKNDTVYTALPSTKTKLDDATLEAIERVTLLPLDPSDRFWSAPQVGDDTRRDEEVPF